ncbi:hypothetical protein RhiirA4_482009, partial [Rhizophagus irregularis]
SLIKKQNCRQIWLQNSLRDNENSEIYSQIKECDEIGEKKFESRSSKDKPKNILQTHSQAIYTSRLLNFKNLPNSVNSSDLPSLQFNSDANYAIRSTLANPSKYIFLLIIVTALYLLTIKYYFMKFTVSECLDVQLSESELNEICQDDENNIES